MIRRASLDEASVNSLATQAASAGYDPARRLLRHWADGSNRFGEPGETFLAAFDGGVCLGFCGLNRDPFVADGGDGDPRVGRVRRLYVAEAVRGRGTGSALVRALLAEAGAFRCVRTRTGRAHFFEALGFRPIEDPDATHQIGIQRAGRTRAP
ncbi:GNAT family N-acetyltransferase [Acuticoccus sediminis]|uniref:GNAT family N-acetyltransferase n=1 Tax=Acuticoccus sediminis TaxID=2184697 RepID=UPI001CFDF20F|nr:GNAT family N-acetyltransferase [Acuticoccus sediminis]